MSKKKVNKVDAAPETKPEVEVKEEVNIIKGLNKSDAMNKLFAEFGDFAKAEEYYKANNTNGRTNSLEKKFNDFILLLEENPTLTEEGMYSALVEGFSKNECRWVSQRNTIRKLANAVAVSLGAKFTEALASADIKKALKDKVEAK